MLFTLGLSVDLVLPGRRGTLPIMVLPVQHLRGREIKQLSIVTLRANDGVDQDSLL